MQKRQLPVQLDETDIAIIRSLMEDGRKSFRAVSRELKISTPTVKARYERLVNIGLIKSIKPELDFTKIEKKGGNASSQIVDKLKGEKRHFHVKLEDMRIKLKCDFCGGPVNSKPQVLKFANFERFFCCTACRSSYKEKYGGRIESLKEQYKKQSRAQ